jgi:hypothetical protein
MKKLISCLLLLVFVFGICACGQTQQEEEFNLDLDALYDGGTVNLDGYECIIIQSFDLEQPFSYPLDTLMSDAVLKRMSDIGKEFNCTVTLTAEPNSYLEGTITKVYSGVHVADIGYTHQPSKLVQASALHPLDVLRDYVDYMDSDKFGSLGMLEIGMKDGVPYTVSPSSWPGKQMSYTYNIFSVNEDLISRYGKVDPRDYYENGEWTWSTFETVLPDYQIEDGDFTATAVNFTWGLIDLAFVNGANLIKVDDAGNAKPALDSAVIAETFDWFSNLYKRYPDCIGVLGYNEMTSGFLAGEIVMAQTSFSHMMGDIVYEMGNYGVVPMPCGPNGTYGEWPCAISDFDSFGIYINAKQPDGAAMVISRMCDPIEGYETLEGLQDYASGIFYDSRDVEFFTTYLKDARWNYWTVGIFDYFGNAKNDAVKGASSSEIIEKYAPAANALVEEYVVPNYDFIKQYEEFNKD